MISLLSISTLLALPVLHKKKRLKLLLGCSSTELRVSVIAGVAFLTSSPECPLVACRSSAKSARRGEGGDLHFRQTVASKGLASDQSSSPLQAKSKLINLLPNWRGELPRGGSVQPPKLGRGEQQQDFWEPVSRVEPDLSALVIRQGATPVSLSLLAIQVYAASSEKDTSKKELLKIEELSLYSSPARETRYVENPQTQLEEEISHLRHAMEPYTAWCQDLYAKAMPKLEKAVEHGREGFDFLQNPPAGFYPRLGVIGFAGIVGLFLARGSKIKKLVYPAGLMSIGASMYYPQQAAAIAKVAGTQLYDWSLQGYIAVESIWKDNPKKKKSGEKSDKGDANGNKPLEIHAASKEERAQK
ncbi:PREDICTED: apolipoprotein O [Apaloderma vittatum]|uniref:apolipoprotein O n=1 Tax=Apaloderma vittatum TaxID=57397 RepID=UPI00052176B7|nr:PREDICTED: apolipoprotein O [Apaloderma vittatum]